MANNELGMRFTNVNYATKNDVAKAMKLPIIDNIWKQILEYRANFSYSLALEHIDGTSYSICLAPAIVEKVNNIERKLLRCMVNFSKLSYEGKKKFSNDRFYDILREIEKKYKINIDDSKLKNIITNDSSILSANEILIMHYLNALNEIEKNYNQNINEDFLAKLYSILLGTNELTEFYRTKEIDNGLNRVLVNKIYFGIPHNKIENSMNNLFNFINNVKISPILKSVCTLYFCYYIKPFEVYNEEIAILLFKQILAYNDLESVASLFNFECLLNDNDNLEKALTESQKSFDLTYFLDYVFRILEPRIDDFVDKLVLSKKSDIFNENYALDISHEDAKPKTEQKNQIIQNNEDNLQNEQATLPTNGQPTLIYNKNIAINSLPEGLNEEEAKKLENHLKELYPSLSNGQAYFYARHCTLGMKYTISQYKKCLNCAYETARTSMDGLVYLGFYSKEPLKNKYIYTPVRKK